jgi:hypothetical protein
VVKAGYWMQDTGYRMQDEETLNWDTISNKTISFQPKELLIINS